MSLKNRIILLIFAAFFAYLPSFNNPFIWDDEQFIYKNRFVQNFAVQKIFTTNTIAGAGENSNYYRPLTTLSFAIDYQMWGLNPLGFHLTNTLLHALAAVLVFLILRELKLKDNLALAVALVFALHPLQAQAVTYMNSRGDSSYTFFAFVSVLLFIWLLKQKRFQLQLYNLQWTGSKTWWAVGAVVAYVLAVFSKEIGLATLGLWGLLLGWFSLTGKKQINLEVFWQKQHTAVITFFAAIGTAVGYLLLRATSLKFTEAMNVYMPGDPYGESILVRLATFAKVLWIYLKLILVPYPLHMERTTDYVLSVFSPWVIATLAVAAALLWLGWREWQRKGSVWIWFGSGWFLGMLVPVSGIIPINGILYEHWLYVPIVGFCLVLIGLVKAFDGERFFDHQVTKVLFGLLMAVYLLLTWHQNYIWGDQVRFYTHTLKYADAARLHNNLAMAYAERGQLDEAIRAYQAALERGPDYPQIYHNMANAYAELKEYEYAREWYEKALETDPGFYFTYLQVIKMYVELGEFETAHEYLDRLAQNVPNSEALVRDLRNQLQQLERQSGDAVQ